MQIPWRPLDRPSDGGGAWAGPLNNPASDSLIRQNHCLFKSRHSLFLRQGIGPQVFDITCRRTAHWRCKDPKSANFPVLFSVIRELRAETVCGGLLRQPDGASQYALVRSIVLPPASTNTPRFCDRHHSLADRLRVRFPLCRPTTASIRVGVIEAGAPESHRSCIATFPRRHWISFVQHPVLRRAFDREEAVRWSRGALGRVRCCGSRTNTSASPIGLKSRHGAFQPFRSRLAWWTTD
jgi:hypothetical protein